jgi:hypothetical protein
MNNFFRNAAKRAGRYLRRTELSPAAAPPRAIEDTWLKEATERAWYAYEKDRQNILDAYEDLEFRAGHQWPAYARAQREAQRRPILTVNRIPQFVRQVTGEIRLMKPAIKVVPIDAKASSPVADLMAGMIRYVENRSEAQWAYCNAADSQVTAGIGAWRVATEYAEATTFNQELRVVHIDDPVSILWDPDSILPTREDAKWCFVPIDLSRAHFEERFPSVPVADFSSYDRRYGDYWWTSDTVRIAEYWEKRPITRLLALEADGSVGDLTDAEEGAVDRAIAEGARVEERDGFKVYRSLITLGHALEDPEEWPGRYIPVVPVLGEEVRIGRKTIRHGMVRFAKDAQRMYNYSRSTQTEVMALAPKAPWIGTPRNFEEHLDEWADANNEALPFLPYTPDPLNAGAPPQRNAPPVSSPGLSEAVALSDNDMKAVTGIYDASLGAPSNEISGVAIRARQQEGNVGTVAYVQNFNMAIRHTGRILVDLIPHIYDTERQIQVLGEDGKIDTIWINRTLASDLLPAEPEDMIDVSAPAETDAHVADAHKTGDIETDDSLAAVNDKTRRVLNDVTVGTYDIAIETGPSFAAKREQAADGMAQLLQGAPQIAPLILDLYARAQDWPLADEIGKRLEVMLPPPVQALLAKERSAPGEIGPNGEPLLPNAPAGAGPLPPNPGTMGGGGLTAPNAAAASPLALEQQAKAARAVSDARIAELNVRARELELAGKQLELNARTKSLADSEAAHGAAHGRALHDIVGEIANLRGVIDGLLDHHRRQVAVQALPPIEGAKRARDGLWYLPDRTRPGKYLLVLR